MDEPGSPTAKTSKEHHRQPGVAAAVRRALFRVQPAGRQGLRLRAAAAAVGTTLLLLLLTAWAGKLRAGGAGLPAGGEGAAAAADRAKVLWQQPKWVSRVAVLHSEQLAPASLGQQAQRAQQGGGSGRGAGSPAEALVEFTAPGLFLPLR